MSEHTYKIAALAGDGIGPEVIREALKVLNTIKDKFGFQLEVTQAPVGWAGIDEVGKALPDDTLELCRSSDSILFGSVGLPDRDPTIPKEERPERAALLTLRKEFGLFANLRPVRLPTELAHACPLKAERQGEGIDMLVVRELTGGMYFGQPKPRRLLTMAKPGPLTPWSTAPVKLNAFPTWPSRARNCAANISRVSTKQMFWRMECFGAKWSAK